MPDRKRQDLVDAGSEYSFPASDPPSYMAGTAIAGAPPNNGITREPVNTDVINPDEVKPVERAPSGSDPARARGDAAARRP